MYSNKKKYLTKREALAMFKKDILPGVIKEFGDDKCARDQAWNDWTDGLCKEGKITLKQYEGWDHLHNERTKAAQRKVNQVTESRLLH